MGHAQDIDPAQVVSTRLVRAGHTVAAALYMHRREPSDALLATITQELGRSLGPRELSFLAAASMLALTRAGGGPIANSAGRDA